MTPITTVETDTTTISAAKHTSAVPAVAETTQKIREDLRMGRQ